jgi:putative endopeptidase
MRPLRFLAIPALTLVLAAQAPTLGFDKANLNPAVKPGDDFYQYAVGGWLKRTPFPADQARYGGFEEVRDRTATTLKGIFAEVSARSDWKKGSVEQQVSDLYASGMDQAAIDAKGLAPLAADLRLLDGLKDAASLSRVLATWHDRGLGGAFGFRVTQDAKQSLRNLAYLNQGGTGLPDRDYYLKDDARTLDIRAKYVVHVARVFELAGEKPEAAKAMANEILALETRIARISWSRTEQRDPVKRYNLKTLAQLEALAPGFDWQGYFKARKLAIQEVCLSQPSYFTEFAKLAPTVSPATWRTYLRWNLLRSASRALPRAFEDESFAFFGKVLNGTPEQEPRWKRVQGVVDGSIGQSLGQLYVKKAFPPEAKAKITALVANLQVSLRERIEKLAWMGPATKAQALAKLQAFGVKVGYPDVWKKYDFEIRRDDWYGNLSRAQVWQVAENKARLGKPIDKKEWGMTPATVNASYSSSNNDITFPAGILQPPFFDPKADDAVNYGAIGFVIGHEMTHGFDDSGSQYDGDGNLKNWWTPEDRRAFDARTDLIVKQFDAFEPLKGEHINGRMTLGENIADLGGLKIAFSAYQKTLNGRPSPVMDGFTGEQRFFIGSAQVWRQHSREAALSVRLKTDVHSPGPWRILGPLANLPEFHQAFHLKDGDPMVRPMAQRPEIW